MLYENVKNNKVYKGCRRIFKCILPIFNIFIQLLNIKIIVINLNKKDNMNTNIFEI